jgi:hypothetical protein
MARDAVPRAGCAAARTAPRSLPPWQLIPPRAPHHALSLGALAAVEGAAGVTKISAPLTPLTPGGAMTDGDESPLPRRLPLTAARAHSVFVASTSLADSPSVAAALSESLRLTAQLGLDDRRSTASSVESMEDAFEEHVVRGEVRLRAVHEHRTLPVQLPTQRRQYDTVDFARHVVDDADAHEGDLREGLRTALAALDASRARVGHLESERSSVREDWDAAVRAANSRAQRAEERLTQWAERALHEATALVEQRAAQRGGIAAEAAAAHGAAAASIVAAAGVARAQLAAARGAATSE